MTKNLSEEERLERVRQLAEHLQKDPEYRKDFEDFKDLEGTEDGEWQKFTKPDVKETQLDKKRRELQLTFIEQQQKENEKLENMEEPVIVEEVNTPTNRHKPSIEATKRSDPDSTTKKVKKPSKAKKSKVKKQFKTIKNIDTNKLEESIEQQKGKGIRTKNFKDNEELFKELGNYTLNSNAVLKPNRKPCKPVTPQLFKTDKGKLKEELRYFFILYNKGVEYKIYVDDLMLKVFRKHIDNNQKGCGLPPISEMKNPVVHYKDGNPRNNSLKNIYWKDTEETYVDLKSYEGIYQISDIGHIKTLGNGGTRLEKLRKNHNFIGGMPTIVLSKNGIRTLYSIPDLVLSHFGEPTEGEDLIPIHIDGNKENNSITNLIWGSIMEAIENEYIKESTIENFWGRSKKIVDEYDSIEKFTEEIVNGNKKALVLLSRAIRLDPEVIETKKVKQREGN